MSTGGGVIGIDFDNTIACFDGLFHRAAVERSLIPTDLPPSKTAVRDFLRLQSREPDWTELQGHVYGVMIHEAPAFPGVLEFIDRCRDRSVHVISHKTRYPFLGPRHDLHQAALRWLEDRGFTRRGLGADRVHFEATREAKLHRIASENCAWFIDDLPEFLAERSFPSSVKAILFDPHDEYPGHDRSLRAASWTGIGKLIL